MTKICPTCSNEFSKPYNESKKAWISRHIYCSRNCYIKSMKGKLPISIVEWNKLGVAWNKGKSLPHWRGAKSSSWKGGTYGTERHRLMGQAEYKLWRLAVFQRDNYICQSCFKRGGDMEADHIKPWSLYPELRYAIDNGRTLCVSCHKQTQTWGRKAQYLSAQEA